MSPHAAFFMCAPNLNGQAYMACAGSREVGELGFDFFFLQQSHLSCPRVGKKIFLAVFLMIMVPERFH